MTQSPPTGELVARLRASGTRDARGGGVYMSICDTAADAITTLDRELEEARAQRDARREDSDSYKASMKTYFEQSLSEHNAKVEAQRALSASQAEVERLKEALTGIDNAWCQFINCRNDQTEDPAYNAVEEQRNVDALGDAVDRARAALHVEERKT
jgi:hypothetical protein